MKQNARTLSSLAAAVGVVALVVGCSKPEAPKTEAPPPPPAAPAAQAPADAASPKALFERKCSVCHATDRATSRRETRERWTELVREMQGKQPGAISDEEAGRIVEFLASEYGSK